MPESSDLKVNQAQQPFAEMGPTDGLPDPASLISGNTFGLIFMGFSFLFYISVFVGNLYFKRPGKWSFQKPGT